MTPLTPHVPQCKALYDFRMTNDDEDGCLTFNKVFLHRFFKYLVICVLYILYMYIENMYKYIFREKSSVLSEE